ncbi:hypothetical protein GcC1_144016 [Golovinomyces cichoracearum]|uniref:Conserved oligomeric Golgi complex subunit 2 n=1 Tax=Golovinomyces cichoracearum TaxID=62708 RepID=A0A420HZH5_9PEZI|nr:hypothetical protein GcC1_144016 [Golovinomyces cichoracearum]
MNKSTLKSGIRGDSEDDNEDDLPSPEELLRSDFLSSDFDASNYLSSLCDRHQSLEDLQSDLRERSQFLSQELIDLVNYNYERFLSLGSDLNGGEEQLEDVRVGLLGFKSGVMDVRGKVKTKKDELERLLIEKIKIRRQISLGRKLLEVDVRLEELEGNLVVVSPVQNAIGSVESGTRGQFHDKYTEDELTTNCEIPDINLEKLSCLVKDYRSLESLMADVGINHPYIKAQQTRMIRNKKYILTNLSKEIHQTKVSKDKSRLLELLGIYRELGAAGEVISILQEFDRRG